MFIVSSFYLDIHPAITHYYNFESSNVQGTLVRNLAVNRFDASLINDAKISSTEGSYIVGTLLKELYIDSALKKADKLNKDPKKDEFVVGRNISFRQFKEKTNSINIK